MLYHSQTPEYSTVKLFIQLGDTEWQWMDVWNHKNVYFKNDSLSRINMYAAFRNIREGQKVWTISLTWKCNENMA